MRNFYYFPVVDKIATGQHIKQLVKEKGISIKLLKSELYDYDNCSDVNELSDQIIYYWYAGKKFPELIKLLRLSKLLYTRIEDIIIYRNEFVEVADKKSKSTETGTKIHSFSKELYFKEENLTIEELQEKYASEFYDLLSYSNKIFQTLFNTYRQRINGWKSKYTNPKRNLPDNQKKLAPIPDTDCLLSLLRMANMKVSDACVIQYFAQKNKKFDFDQFESKYERIRNKSSFEEQYKKVVEERRKITQLYMEDAESKYNEEAEDYDQQSLEELVYCLDEALPESILKKKLDHDVLIELRKNYETKIAKYDLSFETGSFSFASYILERAEKEKIFDEEDFKKFKEYVLYMVFFKEMDDYQEFEMSLEGHTE